jgi:fructose-1,6-bisphosphatase/inositol monophosphatase family enzyme
VDTSAVLDLLKEVAATVITPRFRSLADGEVMEKKPGDLVTVADREAEVLITAALASAHPDAVVLGEEAYAADHGLWGSYLTADHAFTVDPIDGTKNFVHGSPDHAVMVAETRGGATVRAWIWQPVHEVAWVAELGSGSWRNGERVRRAPLEDGIAPHGATSMWALRGQPLGDLPAPTTSWRCCGVDYPKLIEGATDYLVFSQSLAWDHAPGALLLREAGGEVGFADGTAYEPRVRTPLLVAAADTGTLRAVRRRLPA